MTARRRTVLALAAASLPPWPRVAWAAEPTAAKISSRHLGADRGYRVQLPASYAAGDTQRYPLLLVLDAQQQFATAANTARFLAEQEEIPELIVVGLDSGKRVHDYTQTDWPQGWVGGGGAAKFKRFIADELLPALNRAYRIGDERLLLGHSASAQFALHLLATEPALFHGYLLMSPSLDWDQRLPVRELEAAFKARERLPGFLYVAEDASLGGALTDQLALRQVLADHAPRGLDWRIVNYPKESHGSVVLPGTVDALRARWQGWRLHPDEAGFIAEANSRAGVDALAERYKTLARGGRSVAIPEPAFIAVAAAHLRRHEAQAAVALLRRAAAAYPRSGEVRDALGRAEKALAAPQAPGKR
jgi:uncharacterized protein